MYTELKTDRLLLRPLSTCDLESVHIYAGDPELTKYMMHLPNDTKADTLRFLTEAEAEWQKEAPAYFEFAVTLEGIQIGAVSLYLNGARTEGELGWIFNRQYWDCGYATESAAGLRNFAFRTLGLQRLFAHCDIRNTGSARVMEKLGMVLKDDTAMRQYRNRPDIARELFYALERPGTAHGTSSTAAMAYTAKS